MSKDRLVIFDTTLRDGEQSPGASMTKEEKLQVARTLEKLGVDVIEAGFAIASPGDFDAVRSIAELVKDSTVCSLSRAVRADIERAGEAVKVANSGRIHTFIATSPIHMKYKLQMEPDQVVEQAVNAVKMARNLIDDVEFSLEDASRSEFDFMCRITEAVIAAGARTINVPDTVGYGTPEEYGDVIGRMIANIPNSDQAIFSVHCHNDLGLAVANSLSAVHQGARQVECTINGLGERAGNASLEEIVMAIRTRQDLYPVQTGIRTENIVPASKLVSAITGFPVQPNKAIVGANAFSHESGIHQDGVLKHRETYEIMKAEDVGWNTNKLVLGKLSGRAAFSSRLDELGIGFDTKEELNDAFARFKLLADKKREIYDDDLRKLVSEMHNEHPPLDTEGHVFKLVTMDVDSRMGETPVAHMVIKEDGIEHDLKGEGNGPVDAVFKAIEGLANSGCELELYNVNAVTAGTESQAEVKVSLNKGDRKVNGSGADLDILVASAKAYINALNALGREERTNPHIGAV
ncbi:2-isopropylmalate synthase [Porticoccus sp. W117]|uniref:2-isopropylmalate synthase n=1 Tax=Porticoccus sp. W117 TaxID=3054777 RepID=UPI002591D797|nr:2-isopropylmalate synthase [Porticoccus sp. W117]MDM3871985.1 2-isopropylmalate synthase [Porticoccus sp. W117]